MGPITEGNRYILSVVDHFTKFGAAYAIPSKNANVVARVFFERTMVLADDVLNLRRRCNCGLFGQMAHVALPELKNLMARSKKVHDMFQLANQAKKNEQQQEERLPAVPTISRLQDEPWDANSMSDKGPTNPPVDVQLGAVSLEDSEDDELQVSAKAVQLVKDIQEMVRQRKQEQDELIKLRQLLALRDQELSVLRRAQEARSGPTQPMEVEETSKQGTVEELHGVNCEDFPLIDVESKSKAKRYASVRQSARE
ncbi:unnamed protein product [Heligmosomoides polygyrus]|uniref:Integrase catalytic domain-containing protein n=1 Tax=Heligmosomoides polygyrus TaxID=6339 RepID=A0A183GP44_HELPZ|nr:unnamed protein product [Heligmosomoides polygyrus]